MSEFEKLRKRFEIFHKIKEELGDLDGDEKLDYESGSWTGIKLFSYSYYNAIYTHIIKEHYNEYYYIDPFAGSGMTKIEGVEEPIPSSALLAAKVKYPYTKLFLSDMNGERLELLEKRLDKLGISDDRYEIIKKDKGEGLKAKESIPRMVSKIFERGFKSTSFHTLAVIDPEGYKAPWSAMKNLKDIRCDLLFTLDAHQLGRTKSKSSRKEALRRFFGSEKEENWTKEGYLECLESLGFNYFEEFTCKKGGNRYGSGYGILVILATKKEDPGWKSAVDNLQRICENNTGKQVEFVDELINGKATNLPGFEKEEDKEKGPLDKFID